jgi:hypothetical protein
MSEDVRMTISEQEELKKQYKQALQKQFDSIDFINELEKEEYIPNGQGRRKVVFRTPRLKTIITMEEPGGKKARKQLDELAQTNGSNLFDVAVTWITKLEFADGETSSNGKNVLNPKDPNSSASDRDVIIKDINDWSIEESECISHAFSFLNRKYLYPDFF